MNDLIQPLSEDIYFIPAQNRARYPYANSLLINDFLFDSGISSGYLRKLRRKVAINNIVLSHWHEDHISGNRLFPKAKYYSHIKDKRIIEDIDLMNYYYFIEDDMDEQVELYSMILEGLHLQNTKIDIILEDNMLIDIGNGLQVKVIHTPGHTEGHCCFYEVDSRIAFLADIDLSGLGPWYGGRDSNLIDFEESIDKMIQYDIDIAVTSHKGVIEGRSEIQERLEKYKQIIYKRDEQILSYFSESKPKSASDLTNLNIIFTYYTDFKVYEVFVEEFMINYHFDKFLKQGIIEKKDSGYILS